MGGWPMENNPIREDSRGNGVKGLVNGRRRSELLSEEALSPWDAVTRRQDRPQLITRQHRRRPSLEQRSPGGSLSTKHTG